MPGAPGKVLLSTKRFPMSAKSASAYIAALRKQSASNFQEDKDNHQWKINFAAFFKGALDRHRALHPPSMEIEHQKFSIKEKMEQMLARVSSGEGPVPLSDVFRSLSGRAEAIAIFLAVLELLRLLRLRLRGHVQAR